MAGEDHTKETFVVGPLVGGSKPQQVTEYAMQTELQCGGY